ncbi:penicillin acylase family protein [Massilia arenosa]|uniref:Penicillin acylase family protein n=1 Tax=Zemynaea arenosa TaxID=2561931 RepID=A0A4Y9ST95_9BURK|nr:penicillin acylase family protein [Massilia arenosa]TFW27966.1 penicillin acylase family protein [Massilia arenosa]
MSTSRLKKWSLRILAGLIGLVLFAILGVWLFLRASLPQLDGTVHAEGMNGTVTVARDERGVPLISGANRLDIAYVTGYVHAQERYFQMDLLRRSAAGELAELFGPKALPLDREHRLHRFRARAERLIAEMDPAERQFLDRYVAGVNDGLHALGGKPFEYGLVGARPRPWYAADSLLVAWAMYNDLQGSTEKRELARGWLRDHSTPEQLAFLLPEHTRYDATLDRDAAQVPEPPIPATAPAWWGKGVATTKVALADMQAGFAADVGSNNWAIAGSRTAGGAAIVSNDMHLSISLPNTWYRLALQYPGADGKPRRIVGLTLPGAPPMVLVGSNGHVAWGFTNSYGDYMDLIEAELDPARPTQIRVRAEWEPIAYAEEIIYVKGQAPERMMVRETSLGPLRVADGKTYAIHWTADAPGALNLNTLRLEGADTVEAALAVANTMGIPAQNFVAGDTQGNIGWTIGGLLPSRGEYGVGASYPLKPGDALGWDGHIDPAAYPRVINPARGQIQTANSRQLIGGGSEIIGDGGFDLGARASQIRDDLAALGGKVDVAHTYAVTLDDRALYLAPWRERALKVLDAAALNGHPARTELRRVLETGWTGRASIDSAAYKLTRDFMWAVGAVVYDSANLEIAKLDAKASVSMASPRWSAVLARLLDAQPTGWLPPGQASWRDVQLAALDRVINEQVQSGVPLAQATWGLRNTSEIAHPISAAVPQLKRWLAAPADQLPGDVHMPRVAGPKFGQSERLTVMPGHEEQGVFNMPGGQSGHPLSPYFLKGHEDWVQGRAEPLLPGPAKYTLTFQR